MASSWPEPSHPPAELESARLVAGRYRLGELLGRGGMADVFAAWDLRREQRVALKQLRAPADRNQLRRALELFEREFHQLSQLAHPRIVKVHDFGLEDDRAYYTMELLQGSDAQRLAPLPWREACALARDVCSALSLLHMRRLVHRDLSPRNVHALPDGAYKLIDFGVVAGMGPAKLLVGTPPCCAPEAVNLQTLDARTDLYALGATLYFVLVGRHAFPATNFIDLRQRWRVPFARPSDIAPEIPKALDALVLELLRLEPDARPASAADVMERLHAIAGMQATNELQVEQAYLATAPLVGRDAQLARWSRRLARALGPRSRSLIFEAAPGAGRTRLLDSCALHATLLGHTVLRCDADDARSGDYGVVRAIARQLFDRAPLVAREASAPLLDELRCVLPGAESASEPPRAQLQRALQVWLSSVSQRQPFVLAVDDFHRIDEPSASLLALFERSSERHESCLLLSVEAGAPWSAELARPLLSDVSRATLQNLSPFDSEQLLRSLFGAVPNLQLLAHRMLALCGGNPRDTLQLAQHLVDRGILRYAAGSWTVPAEIAASELPASLAQALRLRVSDLSEEARRLAEALALCPDRGLSLDDCAQLLGGVDRGRLGLAIEQLNAHDIARSVDEGLVLRQPFWIAVLREGMSRERELPLQRELGALFELCAGEELRAAQHWFRAGRPEHALDLLVAHARSSQERTAHGAEIFAAYLRRLPPGWFETFEEGLRACDALHRPLEHKFTLLSRLAGIMPMLNMYAPEHTLALFEILRRDSGLLDFAALPPGTEPALRLQQALELARARHERAPQQLRVHDPAMATAHLVRAVVGATAGVMLSLDLSYLRSWPSLRPLAPLSLAVEVAVHLIDGVDARCAGRTLAARRLYEQLIALVDRPDRAGLDASHAQYVKLGVMNGLGVLEAMAGMDSSLGWAERIANSPAYEVNALLIRMLHALFQGDAEAADRYKFAAERARVQNSGRPMYEGQHLLGEVQAHALAGDLTRLRRTREDIAPFAARHVAWGAVLHYAQAEHARLCGDPVRALGHVELALQAAPAGAHQIWPAAASTHVFLLLELERSAEALERAESHLALAASELDALPERLLLARALARAQRGAAGAASDADAVLERMQSAGFGALQLGAAHELRARIAALCGDGADFDRHASRCRELFSRHKHVALTAKYHQLLQDGMRMLSGSPSVSFRTPAPERGVSRVEQALAGCRDDAQRARLALSMLATDSGAPAGCLFMLAPDAPSCVAELGDVARPEDFRAGVAEYVASLRDPLATCSQDEAPWLDRNGAAYRPFLLAHEAFGERVVCGVVVLAIPNGGELACSPKLMAAISRFYDAHGAASVSLIED